MHCKFRRLSLLYACNQTGFVATLTRNMSALVHGWKRLLGAQHLIMSIRSVYSKPVSMLHKEIDPIGIHNLSLSIRELVAICSK